MSKFVHFAVMVFAIASNSAEAILVDSSTTEALSFRYCIAGDSGCDSVDRPISIVIGGTPGAPISNAAGDIAGVGSATGTVSLSGIIGAPIFHSSATSEHGARVNTTAVALQSYTYSGATATTRTFGGTLTYSQSLTGIYPGGNGNGIYAAIDIFTLSSQRVEVGNTPDENFGTLVDPASLPGYSDVGYKEYSDTNSTIASAANLGVTVTLQPGENIWVWALLQTPALNGSVVDASHTFVTQWDNPLDLHPAISVPEPPTSVLAWLGVAFFALLLIKRRAPSHGLTEA